MRVRVRVRVRVSVRVRVRVRVTVEALALGGQLAHDVVRREDGLEVHPRALALDPLLEDLRHEREHLLPVVDALRKRPLERREGHALRHHDVVVEQHLHLVEALEHEGARLAVGRDVEAHLVRVRVRVRVRVGVGVRVRVRVRGRGRVSVRR